MKNDNNYSNRQWLFVIRLLSLDLTKNFISKQFSNLTSREIDLLNSYAKQTYMALLNNGKNIYHVNTSVSFLSKHISLFDKRIKNKLSKNSHSEVIDWCIIYLGTLDGSRSSATLWKSIFTNNDIDTILLKLDIKTEVASNILNDIYSKFIHPIEKIDDEYLDIDLPYDYEEVEHTTWDLKIIESEDAEELINIESSLTAFLIEYKLELLQKHLAKNYDSVILDQFYKWIQSHKIQP